MTGRGDEASLQGRRFYKLTGSGNDFLFFDLTAAGARGEAEALAAPETIARLCARGTGVGADGVVLLERGSEADVRIRYFNSDGSLAALCGNATLCTTALAARLGAAAPEGMRIETGAGTLTARVRDGSPEFDLAPVREVTADFPAEPAPGERRIGFALSGVPHIVVLCDDVAAVDLPRRSLPLRHHSALEAGANVNYVSRDPSAGRWSMRTFERGVEGETLACGTGAVATAVLLATWGESGERTELRTRSGEPLVVSLRRDAGAWHPSLRGEGRIVFQGVLEG